MQELGNSNNLINEVLNNQPLITEEQKQPAELMIPDIIEESENESSLKQEISH